MEIKRTQQDISSLKKQLSELRGFFKGKERKSLEGRIELLEDLEKRLHRSMEQIVKREGYPNVQSFQKVYNKAEKLIMEYNEELRAWKIRRSRRKKIRQNSRKKQVYWKNYTAISRKADSSRNGQLRKNLWIENDKKGGKCLRRGQKNEQHTGVCEGDCGERDYLPIRKV